jgi:glycosyltransferase involved in cell wall biosynthesis
MSNPELATVAMVTYNSEKYVSAAISSVLSQSYENLELVIVDDASADRTWEIICGQKDSRIRAYRNAANVGEYPNRNLALHYARGKYVVYIDGDDILYPHGLDFMVRSLREFPNAAMALARPWNEKIVYPLEITPREFYLYELLGRGAAGINFAHILFRTSILNGVGGLPTAYKQGDLAVQYRIALEHNSVLISDGLAWWRRTPGQASETVLKAHSGCVESLKCQMEYLDNPKCPLSVKEKELAIANICGVFIRIVLRYVLKGRLLQGVSLLTEAGIPLRNWRFALVPSDFSYRQEITSASPLTSGIHRNPFHRK